MTEQEAQKLIFTMVGSRTGVPTLDDLLALYKHLTGRDPSPEEIAECKAMADAAGYPTGS